MAIYKVRISYICHLRKVVAHKKNFIYKPLAQGSCALKEFYIYATCARQLRTKRILEIYYLRNKYVTCAFKSNLNPV